MEIFSNVYLTIGAVSCRSHRCQDAGETSTGGGRRRRKGAARVRSPRGRTMGHQPEKGRGFGFPELHSFSVCCQLRHHSNGG